MKKTTLLIIVMAMTSLAARSQLSLEQCHRMARDNYPAVRQYRLVEQSRDFNISNAGKGYLPQVSAIAGTTVFSDIMNLPGSTPVVGDIKNEAFLAGVQVSQTIYDGGNIASKKRIETANADVSNRQLDVTMYDVYRRVNDLYFGILVIDEEIKQNLLLQKDLGISMNTVSEMMKGGIANQNDIDAVKVELLKAQQAECGMRTSRQAYIVMLGTFTGARLTEETRLTTPVCDNASTPSLSDNNRPELAFYTSRQLLLDEQRKALNVRLRPTVSAFGLGAVHNKVIGNMNSTLFSAGLTVSWSIGSLYTRRNDLHKIEVERDRVGVERETFLFNNRLQNENVNGKIANIRQQIEKDESIVTLRENIRGKSETRVQNGIENVNEMLRDINAVSEARQNKAIHTIQLLNEIYNLKNLNNN